ncbi:hypothetical protein B9Z55_016894 [Caenorhabditis nigoni]|nr:hypothetical protein B9Z55_016894 [Caenorhabditis nigoni]
MCQNLNKHVSNTFSRIFLRVSSLQRKKKTNDMIKQLLLITLLTPISVALLTDQGSFFVRGILTCNGNAYSKMPIETFEKNYIFKDDLLTTTTTNDDGSFYIKYSGKDLVFFNPYIYVPNYCLSETYNGLKCTTGAMMIQIPREYISASLAPDSEFVVGEIDMAKDVPFEAQGLARIFGGALVNTHDCMAV